MLLIMGFCNSISLQVFASLKLIECATSIIVWDLNLPYTKCEILFMTLNFTNFMDLACIWFEKM